MDDSAKLASLRAYVGAFSEHRSSLESPSTDLVQAISMFDDGIPTAAGIRVSPDTALRHIAVYAAVRVLAESLGSLPFPVTRAKGRSRVRVDYREDLRAYLLNNEPNPYQSAEMFWTTVIGHANLWGNGYAVKDFDDKTGTTRALWLLDPRSTAPYRRPDGSLYYGTRLADGQFVAMDPWEVIHIKAFGTGDLGISPIGVARQAIGEALAAEEYAGRFWQNDARPGGIIQYAKKLSDADHSEALRKWRSAHEGARRAHMVAILDNGAEWKDVGIPPGDAQFIETRKFGVRQIASLFRVPPHKIGDLEGTVTHASIEQQSMDFVSDSLVPWAVRVEQGVRRCLFPAFSNGKLTPDGETDTYPKFKFDALTRGDQKSRFEAYALGRSWGFLSANDVCELEDREDLGEAGDVYLQPMNFVPAGTKPEDLATASANARAILAGLIADAK